MYTAIYQEMKRDFTLQEVFVNTKAKGEEEKYSFSKSKKDAEGWKAVTRADVTKKAEEEAPKEEAPKTAKK